MEWVSKVIAYLKVFLILTQGVQSFVQPRFPAEVARTIYSDGTVRPFKRDDYRLEACGFGAEYIITNEGGGCYDAVLNRTERDIEWSYSVQITINNETSDFSSRSLNGDLEKKLFILRSSLTDLEKEIIQRWPFPLNHEDLEDIKRKTYIDCQTLTPQFQTKFSYTPIKLNTQSTQGDDIDISDFCQDNTTCYNSTNYDKDTNETCVANCTVSGGGAFQATPSKVLAEITKSVPMTAVTQGTVVCSTTLQRCEKIPLRSYSKNDLCYILPERIHKITYVHLTNDNLTNFQIMANHLPSTVTKEPVRVGVTDETWLVNAITALKWKDVGQLTRERRSFWNPIGWIIEIITIIMAVWMRVEEEKLDRAFIAQWNAIKQTEMRLQDQFNALTRASNLMDSTQAILEQNQLDTFFNVKKGQAILKETSLRLNYIEALYHHAERFLLKLGRVNTIKYNLYNVTEAELQIQSLGMFYQGSYPGRSTLVVQYTTYDTPLPKTLSGQWWHFDGKTSKEVYSPILDILTCGFFVNGTDPVKLIGSNLNFWDSIKALKRLGFKENETLEFTNSYCENPVKINVQDYYKTNFPEYPILGQLRYVPLQALRLEDPLKAYQDTKINTGDWRVLTKGVEYIGKGINTVVSGINDVLKIVREGNPLQLLGLGIANIAMIVVSFVILGTTWSLQFFLFKWLLKK